MKEFQDKVAVITGGNSGIGYAAAKQLIENGARVLITGRRKEAVDQAAAELGAHGMVSDQSNISDLVQLVLEVRRLFGKIDFLLINAGVTKFSPIEFAEEVMVDQVMDVNFKGAYLTLSKFIPLLHENASVVLLSSTSAHISPPGASVYAASKAALNAFAKIAALELAPRKIRVNTVSPGPVSTEIMAKIGMTREIEERMLSSIPMSRMGRVDEVAQVITFLLSDKASFITGSEYLVDGGQCI